MNRTEPQLPAPEALVPIYLQMFTSREIDDLEQSYAGRGEASFFVGCGGHEAMAALAPHLIPEDYLHCHYRDRALMLARGMSPEELLLSLFAKDGSFSRGRQMHALVSCARVNILSIPTPVGNGALQAAGIAAVIKDRPERPLALCSLGDGTTQQGEVMEAVGQAARDGLPVLFLVQDNGLAISTRTGGKTMYSTAEGREESFLGTPIRYADGRRAEEMYRVFQEEVGKIRETRRPRIVVAGVERLASHSNADDQRLYRREEEILRARREGDPVVRLRDLLVDRGVSAETLDRREEAIRRDLTELARRVQRSRDPAAVFDAARPLSPELRDPSRESRGREDGANGAGMTMLEALRETLRERLASDPRVFLFGEDIEDPKGDVFGLTRGLSETFPGRVVNSPLAESTILGYSVGRALAGDRPVAFLQFADFMPVAYNQIFSELASMHWRTDGSWQAPVIVMATYGGYRPGLGPFHASSMEALAAHTPGLDVFMPSTAADAAGLLNAAFDSGRPTIFLYPKTLLNDRSRATAAAPRDLFVPPGRARFLRRGGDITLVAWGNTVDLCLRAAAALESASAHADVIDLRSIVPWDEETVLTSAEKTGRLLVVHEDSRTCGMGAEIAATVAEKARAPVAIRRLARADTWVPYNFENQLEVLPSFRKTLEAAVGLLEGAMEWRSGEGDGDGVFVVKALGSSPADESVSVMAWKVKPGDPVEEGTLLAETEADKAALELNSPVAGRVETLLVEEGFSVPVGAPLLRIRTSGSGGEEARKPALKEEPGVPVIRGLRLRREAAGRRETGAAVAPVPGETAMPARAAGPVEVGILGIAGATGSRRVGNEEISRMCPTWSPEDIVKRTGIASRPWLGRGETALTLAVDACGKLFARNRVRLQDIDLILCATGTPIHNTPALATMIHHELAAGDETSMIQAYDISAACTGYLYGLQIAYDFLQSRPGAKILLVTSEALSTKTDTRSEEHTPIFGDAATATLLAAGDNLGGAPARVLRPVLSARGESGDILRVPSGGGEKIFMEGRRVFQEAVRGMISMLEAACGEAGIPPEELDLIVPHQANQRIINAVRQKMKAPEEKVFSNIRDLGNTSSSTIPLCLETILREGGKGRRRLGLTAFGGGFTFGGGIVDLV